MKPVLIYKDTPKIKQSQDFFTKSLAYVQQVYDRFKTIGITLPQNDLSEIILALTNPATLDCWLEIYLSELPYLQNIEQIKGHAIQAVRSFIVAHPPAGLGFYNLEPNLMNIDNGRVRANADALEVIERRFSFYANNERGAELSAVLYKMADAANSLTDYLIKNEVRLKTACSDIPGLVFYNHSYRPDISFIRDQEGLFANRRLRPNKNTILESD